MMIRLLPLMVLTQKHSTFNQNKTSTRFDIWPLFTLNHFTWKINKNTVVHFENTCFNLLLKLENTQNIFQVNVNDVITIKKNQLKILKISPKYVIIEFRHQMVCRTRQYDNMPYKCYYQCYCLVESIQKQTKNTYSFFYIVIEKSTQMTFA